MVSIDACRLLEERYFELGEKPIEKRGGKEKRLWTFKKEPKKAERRYEIHLISAGEN